MAEKRLTHPKYTRSNHNLFWVPLVAVLLSCAAHAQTVPTPAHVKHNYSLNTAGCKSYADTAAEMQFFIDTADGVNHAGDTSPFTQPGLNSQITLVAYADKELMDTIFVKRELEKRRRNRKGVAEGIRGWSAYL